MSYIQYNYSIIKFSEAFPQLKSAISWEQRWNKRRDFRNKQEQTKTIESPGFGTKIQKWGCQGNTPRDSVQILKTVAQIHSNKVLNIDIKIVVDFRKGGLATWTFFSGLLQHRAEMNTSQ